MRLKHETAVVCLAAGFGLAGQALAQEPAPPAPPTPPRAATGRYNRVSVVRGGSYLGLGVADIDAERAKALKLKEERGVEVTSVEPDGPAAKAGLKEGDVVLEYNGQRVEGTEQFVRMVRETPPGRTAHLLVSRNGTNQTVTATVGTRRETAMMRDMDGRSFTFTMPPMPEIPPMPPMPDLPRGMMSWRNSTLGIESEALSSQLAEFFGVKEGVLVRSVVKGSAAEKAGIKAGDVIVKVDGSAVTSPREISGILRGAHGKKTLPVVVVRNQKEMTLTVTQPEGDSYHGFRSTAVAAHGFC